ncbi:hypothetical protein [Telmatospirillum sp.]|uniref:arsenate reductase/protein-tyrosine-phosphatase family protein n=1 Tax=Telmatospirillum sp. TaxID=2079197 RepID=UPI00283F6683|nr:hypothetical protein [Telmatospirillum sp.]MDR3439922.1 hypothetical protein [Telmatospirillum sp.]
MGTVPPLTKYPASQYRGKVLVFGDDTRSFLATVRSLGRQGIEVHAAPFDFLAPALASRYISAVHWVPYYIKGGQAWLTVVRQLLETHSYDLVIPCDERALLPLVRHRDELGRLSRLALPDDRALDVFYDKHRTRELAQSLGVPVAPGRLLDAGDTVQGILAEVPLPLVVKPRRSYSADNLYSRGRVRIAENAADLTEILSSACDGTHIFEGFFPGQGVGVSVLAHQGRVLQAFQHHRVHERGGSGYYRVSAPLSKPLIEAVNRIVAAAVYTGVAMFEFKVNRETLSWILLEVNARPWGSLPLPVGLGVDFPYDWYRLLVDGVETPSHSYRVGIHARNLVPDLLGILAEASECWKKPRLLAGLLLRTLWEGRYLLTGREFHDVLVQDDPRPALSEWKCLFGELFQRLSHRLPGAQSRLRNDDRAAVRSAFGKSAETPFNVVFVCQGNICRSPFAALVLQRRIASDGNRLLSSRGISMVAQSAGMLPGDGKASPTVAVEAAERAGINLGTHRSSHFSREVAEAANLVVIFDDKNRRWLRQRYPRLAAPVVFLGSFSDESGTDIEIADPDGADLPTFQRTYVRIEGAVSGLLSVLHNSEKN